MDSRQEAVRAAILHSLQRQPELNPNHTAFLDDQAGNLDGGPVTNDELEQAMSRLYELRLIAGVRVEESPVPAQPYLTAEGKACLEYHQGSVAGWYEAKQPQAGSQATYIYGNSNQVAAHVGGNVTQIQSQSFSQQELNLIRTAARAVTDALPSLPEDQQLDDAARQFVAEAEKDAPDPSRLERLRSNVLLAFQRIGLAGAGSALGNVLVEQLNQLPF